MASKVSTKCFIEQETGFLVNETDNYLQPKSMMMCQMTPFMVTKEGNITILL